MSPKRIAKPLDIYIRVSDVRGRSGESFISPRDQEERCLALARARGYEIGEVFEELDVSGGNMRRPKLEEAIARVEAGLSAGIIVAKLDRFCAHARRRPPDARADQRAWRRCDRRGRRVRHVDRDRASSFST